ncbi:MAG: GIY-YIG nuclease family protein, partial [Planctomycetes bacterium]|nr:GIY-YIG nuclease family protein [Planctomycetota bacterium]
MATGHVYIMQNPALPGLLKIGRTTKTPQERARSLSGTSVPTDFTLVYSVYVRDCAAAERMIHAHLARYREKRNREFFRLPAKEAIRELSKVARIVGRKHRFSLLRIPVSLFLAVSRVLAFLFLLGTALVGVLVALAILTNPSPAPSGPVVTHAAPVEALAVSETPAEALEVSESPAEPLVVMPTPPPALGKAKYIVHLKSGRKIEASGYTEELMVAVLGGTKTYRMETLDGLTMEYPQVMIDRIEPVQP